MSGYSAGLQSNDTVSVTTSGTTAVGNIVGPAGREGRITGITARTTTIFTVADAEVVVQTKGGGTTYGRLTLPFTGSALDDVNSGFTVDDVSDSPQDTGRIPADEILEVVSDGGHTAGAADITVFIEWS